MLQIMCNHSEQLFLTCINDAVLRFRQFPGSKHYDCLRWRRRLYPMTLVSKTPADQRHSPKKNPTECSMSTLHAKWHKLKTASIITQPHMTVTYLNAILFFTFYLLELWFSPGVASAYQCLVLIWWWRNRDCQVLDTPYWLEPSHECCFLLHSDM